MLAYAATVYDLTGPQLPIWLWPGLEATGLLMQLLSLATKKRLVLLAGLLLAVAGGWMERDIALMVGDLAVCAGLWFGMKS